MKALIDSDIVAHRVGFGCKNEPLDINLMQADILMRNILAETGADSYEAFLSGGRNFRYDVNPEYKANRSAMVRPPFLQEIREFLVTEWKAKVCDGIEADDALGIAQMTYSDQETVICSIDKDLKQIPGQHYNFVSKVWELVNVEDGLRFFYEQLLIGDRVDNIFGIDGIGPKKAAKAYAWCETEYEMFTVAQEIYNDDARLLMNGRCLRIQQQDGEPLWEFPTKDESSLEGEGDVISVQI